MENIKIRYWLLSYLYTAITTTLYAFRCPASSLARFKNIANGDTVRTKAAATTKLQDRELYSATAPKMMGPMSNPT